MAGKKASARRVSKTLRRAANPPPRTPNPTRRKAAARTRSPAAETAPARPQTDPKAAQATHAAARGFIAGIGASAGGLEALNAFFDALPVDSGIAFVVVTHQHPDHVSLLPELLSRRTRLPVQSAISGVTIEPDHVYVSPAGFNVAILNGTIQLMTPLSGADVHLPIDYFFRSLARDQGERAICIVLSGTGTDGTLGLRAIKEAAGMALVQDEHTAHFSGMPHSAAATKLADYVLAPEQMPAQLLGYVRAAQVLSPTPSASDSEFEEALPKIFVLLRNRLGHDFSGYKLKTIQRRIERRMRIHQLRLAHEYVSLLQAQPHELDLLFQELLISVTQFFRDPSAFDALGQQLQKRLAGQASLRAWVPGCATGEEAYSIAMLASEVAERCGQRLAVQLFATDIDPHSVEFARAGLYPNGIAADVGPERLQRFFVAEAEGYRIRKDIRDRIVFATHDLLRDPPFTRLDLVCCRNLLIYLNADLQRRLLPLFHYSLKPDGLLWLGTSETAASDAELFEPLDRKWKIYERRRASPVALPRLYLPRGADASRTTHTRERSMPIARFSIVETMDKVLLERFVPPTLMVSDRGEVVCIHGRTGKYLEPSSGEPRNNIFAMAREGLRLCLQSAIRIAAAEDREVVYRGVAVQAAEGAEQVDVIVGPVTEPEALRGLLRVSFAAPEKLEKASAAARGKRTRTELHIESELRYTRESLQAMIDELQSSNEELKSTNEELQSTNEELQSANEELETSKEEMQSLNEELQTVNAELQQKMDELAHLNDDMQNLLNGTDIATLFLDRELKIKRFTEQARRVIRLIASDVGRSIRDIVPQVHYERLVDDAKLVLNTLQPHETEVQALDGHAFLVRMVPYRTAQNAIDGVVITFVDVDRVKRAETLAAARAFAENIVQTVREPLVVLEHDLHIVATNRAFACLTGIDQQELEGTSLFESCKWFSTANDLRARLESVVSGGQPLETFELSYDTPHAGSRHFQLNARRLEEPGVRSARLLVLLHDASPRPQPA
jgi:two-component system, chemotaxis family, CheB/CheR fusion protein